MGFNDEYQKLRKKRLEQEQEKKPGSGMLYQNKTLPKEDVAPIVTAKGNKNENEGKKWWQGFAQKGDAFEDGYQFGDVAKTVLGTVTDVGTNLVAGVVGWGENLVDAGAAAIGTVYEKMGKTEKAEKVREFATKDLYDEQAVAKKILHSNVGSFVTPLAPVFTPISLVYTVEDWMNEKDADNSVLGDVSDSLVQSAGETAVKMGINTLAGGLPIGDVITGVTVFGEQAEQALREDATFMQAGGSALISAGAEILFERLSGGIKFGGRTLDEGLTRLISQNISNVALRNLTHFGLDVAGEGFEEVATEFVSNLGTKLYKEEDLGEILFSEEALNEYIQSAIGGGLMGGAFNVGGAVSGTKSGVDYKTGLNNDESRVVEKIVEERIAEQEKDGKLSGKEKEKIREQVMKDLERGRISVDDIERILGGASYETYKGMADTEAAKQAEVENKIKELENLPNEKITYKQAEQLKALRQELQDLKDSAAAPAWHDRLSESVMWRASGTRLAESYRETQRRGQAFQADLSRYDAKQAEIVKKATESGVLNNTNRTHEFVDMVAKISADKGVLFDFTNNAKLKESGFAVEGATVNGYFDAKTGTIGVNIDSAKALDTVVGHEITHVLEGTELYSEMQKAVFEYARTKGEFDGRREALAKLYAEEDIDSEMTADLIGEYLFTDEDFVKNLSVQNRNVFQKIYDEIKYLCKVVTAGSKEARELERVKRAFDKAYKESGKASGDVKHSLSDSDGKQLSKGQQEYFKDSKMRDENGNLMVMYHGSQDAGFHVFDPGMSDDDTSLFFVDRNDVAASYSGTSETYEAKAFQSADDANKFFAEIGKDEYAVVEHDGKYTLLDDGDEVATSADLSEIYEEFCDYEGVGYGDANYKVYLNLKNPLVVDGKGRPWNKIDAEFSQEIYDKYQSLTAEEKDALIDLAEWEDFSLFNSEIQEATEGALASAYAKMGEDCNIYDLFSVAADNFSEESMRENARQYLKTRDYAKRAKEQGYDGVIFNNIVDNGGYSNGSEGASTVAIAFESSQIKSVANENPTGDADIRYSLSEDADSYSRIYDMQVEVNQLRKSIQEFEASEDFKLQMSRLSEAIANDDIDAGVKAYQKWRTESGYDDLIAKRDKLQAELESLRNAYNDSLTNKALEQEAQAIAKSGLSEADYFRKQAVKEFGYTPYFYDAGYITPNGKMLNFSGEKGYHYGGRGQDHRAIGTIYADTEGSDALNRFVKDGNIRIMAESPGIDISTLAEPTKEQYATIKKFAYEYANKEYFNVDFTDENGRVVGSLQYEGRINPTRIINDIKHYYATGEIREQSSIDRFRFSLSEDSEGRKLSEGQAKYFENSKVKDENGNLLVTWHGTNEDFNVFDFSRIGKTNGKAEGYGFYFSDDPEITSRYGGTQKEVYLNITKPLFTNKKTIKKQEIVKFVNSLIDFNISKYADEGLTWQDSFISNYVNTYDRGMTRRYAVQDFVNQIWDYHTDDANLIYEIANADGKSYSTESMREFYDVLTDAIGYDGIIAEWTNKDGTSKVYVTFNSEQSKYVTNYNPTVDEDMRYSLSAEGEAPGKGRFYGKDIRLDVAPVADAVGETVGEIVSETETIAPEAVAPETDWMPEPEETYAPTLYDLRDERDALREQMIAVQDDLGAVAPLAQRYGEVMQQIQQLEADESERLASLDDADVPPEVEAPYVAEREPITIDDQSLEKITGEVGDMLGLDAEDRARMAQTIQNYAQSSEMTESDLFNEILDNYEYYEEVQIDNDEADAARRFIKGTKLYLPENLKGDFDGKRKDGFNAFRREHFGHFTITTQKGAGARSVDSLYQELNDNFPDLFPADIWNAAEQLQRMADVASMKPRTEYRTGQYDPDTVGEAVELIRSGVAQYAQDEKLKAFNKEGDRLIRMYGKTLAPVVDTPTIETASKSEVMGQQTMFEEPAKKDRFEQMLEREMATLEKEFAQRRSEMEAQLGDKNAYIGGRAMELYNEISNLKKGVRATRELGYLLDHGFEWRTIKSKLLTIKRYPGEVINPDSVEETTIREMLSREYEDKVYELSELGNEYQKRVSELEERVERERKEAEKAEQLIRRAELHKVIVDRVRSGFAAKGFDFDKVLKNARNLSTFATVDNTPQRVMEKALGYKAGQILADETVNKVAQNETEGIKWLNSYTDRKSGLLAKISKQYHIKPGSKESAAAQMYAEGFFVSEQGDTIFYGDAELAKDFPDARTQENIKGLARDPRIRQIYDETLAMINESRVRNGYPEIQKLDNYFLHFRAMDDTFSRLGLPFNPNDIKAKDLPTDLNGVTADLKPGQPYFASAMHRRGVRTTHDLLGGLERYLSSAKNQIYHIDDIQTLRALRNYIADTYGQANGLESLDVLSEEEVEERIKQVFGAHLSTFAKFLNEEANVIAGKTALIDRGLEGIIGRRGMTFMDSINKQVGANMVGFNVSSSLTNFLPVVQAFAKTNKYAFVKGFAQTVSNRVSSIAGGGDNFAQNSPVMVRRQGADRFYRTPFQKVGDAGYALMGAVDSISTEIIARAKYNELIGKGLSETQAHTVTDKWVSRLMGDRSLGQMPQLYNSKMLGLVTKFQLEVRNQLDSQFYDTIQEAKVSNEHIENQLARNAKTAAKVASTFFQLAVAQHIFGAVFESIAGYNPAFDIIEVIMTALGLDDDEESEDTVLDNVEQGFLALLEDLPYTSTFTGGRIPISNALPIEQLIKGEDEYGNEKPRWKTALEVAPYYVLPGGYGQAKKTAQGLSMFSDKLPVTGSYTDSGNLRFPVEETPGNVAQAAIFGQWANENARYYFDNDIAPLNEKQTQEYADVGMSIRDYWKYRKGLSGLKTLEEKAEYIDGLDLTDEQKNILINNIADREEDIDMSDYDQYGSFGEFDFAAKNPEKYEFFKANGISYEDYDNADEDGKRAYTWAYENPEKYTVAKSISDDFLTYYKYKGELNDITADKDENGESIRGSAKDKKIDYINNLDLDYGQRIILFKSLYKADDTYNADIVDYLNEREDISYEDMVTILTELGFTVKNGNVYWD